jgi:hypothetical protein
VRFFHRRSAFLSTPGSNREQASITAMAADFPCPCDEGRRGSPPSTWRASRSSKFLRRPQIKATRGRAEIAPYARLIERRALRRHRYPRPEEASPSRGDNARNVVNEFRGCARRRERPRQLTM